MPTPQELATREALLAAAIEAALPFAALCGGVVLENGHLVVPDHAALLVYDNNGRFVRPQLRDPAPPADALGAVLREVAALPRVLPQVRVTVR